MRTIETILWIVILIGTAHVAHKLHHAITATINTPFAAVAMAIGGAGK